MTGQAPEILLHRGRRLDLATLPLEPLTDGRRLDAPAGSGGWWSSCLRGYVGTWRIRQGRLYLVRLGAPVPHPTRWAATTPMDLRQLGQGSGPIHAWWFTGWLRCPQGRSLAYAFHGFAGCAERDLFVRVRNGMVAREEVVHYHPDFPFPLERPPRRRAPARLRPG